MRRQASWQSFRWTKVSASRGSPGRGGWASCGAQKEKGVCCRGPRTWFCAAQARTVVVTF